MSVQKIVVDSGIIANHVSNRTGRPTALRLLMSRYFCYTTVFQAVELFAVCRSEEESGAVEDALHAMKLLGLNAKSGKSIGSLARATRSWQERSFKLLVAGLCIESRLPLVTDRPAVYRGIVGLDVRNVSQVLKSKG